MKSKSKSLILNLKILIENFFSKSKPALIMTILARDEGDIVEENIKFHLNHKYSPSACCGDSNTSQ